MCNTRGAGLLVGKARGKAALPRLLGADAGALVGLTRLLTLLLPQLAAILPGVETLLTILRGVELLLLCIFPFLTVLPGVAPLLPALFGGLTALVAAFLRRGALLLPTFSRLSIVPAISDRFAAFVPAFLPRLLRFAPVLSDVARGVSPLLPRLLCLMTAFLAHLGSLRRLPVYGGGPLCGLPRGRLPGRNGPWRGSMLHRRAGCRLWPRLCFGLLLLLWLLRQHAGGLNERGCRYDGCRSKQMFDHITVPKFQGRPAHMR
jgi:hypothetical protein